MSRWYYQAQGETLGPVSREEISRLLQAGELHLSDMVYKEGDAKWKVLVEVDEIERRRSGPAQSLAGIVELPDQQATVAEQWVVLVKKASAKDVNFTQLGPYSTEEVRTRLTQKSIQFSDYCWKPGMKEWQLLGAQPEFDRRGTRSEQEALWVEDELPPVELDKKQQGFVSDPDEVPNEAIGEDLVPSVGVKPLKPPPKVKEVAKSDEENAKPAFPQTPPQAASLPKIEKAPELPPVPPPIPFSPSQMESRGTLGEERETQPVSLVPATESKDKTSNPLKSSSIQIEHRPEEPAKPSSLRWDFDRVTQVAAVLLLAVLVLPLWNFLNPSFEEDPPAIASQSDDTLEVSPLPTTSLPKEERLVERQRTPKATAGRERRKENLKQKSAPQRRRRSVSLGPGDRMKIQVKGRRYVQIVSNLPAKEKIRVQFRSTPSQVMGAPGFYANYTFRQKSTGVVTLDSRKLKIPEGTYLVRINGGRLSRKQKVMLSLRDWNAKDKAIERKKWSMQRNYEKRRLYYKSRDLAALLKKLSDRAMSPKKATRELKNIKTTEVKSSQKNIVRSLAFAEKWRELGGYIAETEKLLNKKPQRRRLSSDSWSQLRNKVSRFRTRAGAISAF